MKEFDINERVLVSINSENKEADVIGFDDIEGHYIVVFDNGEKGAFYSDDINHLFDSVKPCNTDYKQIIETKSGEVKIADLVTKDLNNRSEMGKKKYGHYLETFNNRSSIQDAYEESLDQSMYLKQKKIEMDKIKSMLLKIIDNCVPYDEERFVIENKDFDNLKWIYEHIDGGN